MKTLMSDVNRRRFLVLSSASAVALYALKPAAAMASTATEIDRDVTAALQNLEASESSAKTLGAKAKAVLIFPKIVKAGLLVGGETGDGALRVNGETLDYYNISALSFGLQAGAQTFGYALFFMNNEALSYLGKSDGWSIGTGPSVVVVDKGFAKSITSTTLSEDVYAIAFGQQGLMAGIGLEGSKITRIHPKP